MSGHYISESENESENECVEDENESCLASENEFNEDENEYVEDENESYPASENESVENEDESYLDEEYSRYKDSNRDEVRPAGDLRTKILTTLNQLKTPVAFAYSAVDWSMPNPVLHVPPYGTLGLPLSTDDAQKIISQARQSPFGKGEKTIVDTTVRKSWELNPNQFSLKNPGWNKAIKAIKDTVTAELGLEKETGNVSAELYKLLLYEPGAFFKPHKDSEKAPGMFATLVVCLPSSHEGGKLVMTHDKEKYEFETASSSDFSCSYAAWYADITHEVLPVVSGYRLVLTYNLIQDTNFEVPSYGLVCGREQQLSTLLEQYNSRLEKKDCNLPPTLLHKLERKYTQANLKLNQLKPPDRAQVEMLSQLSAKLKFHIYLATLELEILRDDECGDEEFDRKQRLKNIVELDGTLVMKSMDYPDGALIDPTARGKGRADKEDHQGPTGNEGAPATYWYRDAVVVLVPPSKQLNFLFQFKSNGSIVEPLYCKLMGELSKDPAQKPKLEQLCELALKQKPQQKRRDPYDYRPQSSDIKSTPPYFLQAVATAFDLGRIDLFDEACKSTDDKIMLDSARMLGSWVANNGVATNTDRLMKGVRVAPSIAQKIDFIKAVTEGFEAAVPKPSSAEKESLKEWSDKAIVTAVTKLTKADCTSLAQLSKTFARSQFESIEPVILKAGMMIKLTFIKELMSTLQQKLNKEQRSFTETIIHNIWQEFVFEVKSPEPKSHMSSYYSWQQSRSVSVTKNELNMKDILEIIETTITILSPECVEKTIIPAMLAAIPVASKECTKELFISLVQMILKNEVPGFKLTNNNAVPPPVHKRLVQALLTKFLLENVGQEPQLPTNWSLPAGSCKCEDCSKVNIFLQDPIKESFDFPCAEARRKHLTKSFTNLSAYDIAIIKGKSPFVWQITKHRRAFETVKSEWMQKVTSATQTLSKLTKNKQMNGRLEAYLQPYFGTIMNANIKELPDLKSLVTTSRISETNENAAPNHSQTGHKRGASDIDLPEAKRTKS